MSECFRYQFVKNEKTKPSEEFKDEAVFRGTSVYDVVRLMKGKPLFLEAHLERIYNSAKCVNRKIWLGPEEIREKIALLAEINDVHEGNIKLVFNYFENRQNFYCYFVPHQYPNQEQYDQGVKTLLFQAVRENPNAKVINKPLRTVTNEIIENSNVYEVILLDKLGNITEGSRSNLFLVRDNTIYSAPLSDILPGTVRQRVVNLCQELDISFSEKRIFFEDLPRYDAAFLTGTSPMILPIRRINSLSFNIKHPILLHLMKSYREKIEAYLEKL